MSALLPALFGTRLAHFPELFQLRLELERFAIGIDNVPSRRRGQVLNASPSVSVLEFALLRDAGTGELPFESEWGEPRLARRPRRCEKALRESEVRGVSGVARTSGGRGEDEKPDQSWNWPTMTV